MNYSPESNSEIHVDQHDATSEGAARYLGSKRVAFNLMPADMFYMASSSKNRVSGKSNRCLDT